MELSGKVVVVPVDWAGAARFAERMAAGGATVVLVGPDGDAVGRLAATLPGRAAAFVADGSDESTDALAAFVAEMFRPP